MTAAGIASIDAAKANGWWDKLDRPRIGDELPSELQQALGSNNVALEVFRHLAPSARMQYTRWISAGKRSGTREKRTKEAVGLLENGQKLGLR